MANHKSARKRMRQTETRRNRNRAYMSSVRSAVKKFQTAAKEGKPEDVRKIFVEAQSALARAGAKGLLHANNAARRVGRLAHILADVEKGEFGEKLKTSARKAAPKKKKTSAKKKSKAKTKKKKTKSKRK